MRRQCETLSIYSTNLAEYNLYLNKFLQKKSNNINNIFTTRIVGLENYRTENVGFASYFPNRFVFDIITEQTFFSSRKIEAC
jgi:hypothetical protein